MVLATVSNVFTKVFGSRNDRILKTYTRRVAAVNELDPSIRKLTDVQLRAKTDELRQRIAKGEKPAAVMAEALAVAREAMDRAVGIRNILNPEHKFDPSKLDGSGRAYYDQVKAQADAIEPVMVLGNENRPVPGWMQVEIPVELYEAVRRAYPESRPPFRARPFDVQLIGGIVLYEGKIAEMKTGEGKTIVAPLACYLAALENLQVYVVTVNDYLVQRDRDWVFPFYYHLGLTVGTIHPYHMQANELKQQAYQCNVVYGTNSEFGFDYLRDNMKLSTAEQVQKHRDMCIIDEVDSILIDEARTPLIISGPAHDDAPRYDLADQLAKHLMHKQRDWDQADLNVQQTMMRIKGLEGDIRNSRDKDLIPKMREEMKQLQDQLPQLEETRDRNVQYYEVEREKKASHLTHDGVAEAQKIANVGSFYVGNNMDLPHLLENALRAHVIYQRDKEYVVQNGEVIIVDEFTGRLMIGRQWSNGLHQAVEAKEKVKIKQETQTLATVTIQNFFKLFKRLAGMTGTAMTEASEFAEIYNLDVVQIPTNVGVVRRDSNDLIFVSEKDKWSAILDEIKSMHDLGRPVLVGTTSVEHSEMLSQLLTRKFSIKHEVLNAKQHEREAHIVENAGELGAVMIATNMAGRGTDIKLRAIDRAALVRHWQMRNLLPREAKPEMSDQEILDLSYKHQARVVLGRKPAEIENMSGRECRLELMRHWVAQNTFTDADKAAKMSKQQCEAALDKAPNFMHHRLRLFKNAEELGGLHIVGTERHESRRIDNQLRGRSGRQGDQGSSRFFISLEDDLMKLFAGKKTLGLLSRFGMKEGDAIEHPMISRAVERAQRKVEERNFEIRKNLLEYDEVMEYQRNAFYGIRQEVLEGRQVEQVIFDYLRDAVEDAVATYLNRDYVPGQIGEWVRQTLEVPIEPFKLRDDDLASLQHDILAEARDEARRTVELTIGEYMSNELPPEEWDLRGLQHWAMSRFSVDIKQNQLREMNIDQVKERLTEAALVQIDRKDLSGVAKFLTPNYGMHQLADWAKAKFDITLPVEELAKLDKEQVAPFVLDKARQAYQRREVNYPIEFVLDMAFKAAQQDGKWAAEQLANWANRRYDLGWTPEDIAKLTGNELREQLVKAQEEWLRGGKLEAEVDKALAQHQGDVAQLAKWTEARFGLAVKEEELRNEAARRDVLLAKGRGMLRAELSQLERFVLLQILDQTWKDHLYEMDQLKDSVGMRAYAEKDPRIEYKREGAALFEAMRKAVRDRVTDLTFRAKLTANVEARNVYGSQQAEHAEAGSVLRGKGGAAGAPAPGGGSAEQQADLEAAQRAGGDGDANMSRRQRRAAAARGQEKEQAIQRRPQFKQRKRRR
ncbi:MAG: preprotein translocase subunit SecA [Phycisphaeraceae bacterium]